MSGIDLGGVVGLGGDRSCCGTRRFGSVYAISVLAIAVSGQEGWRVSIRRGGNMIMRNRGRWHEQGRGCVWLKNGWTWVIGNMAMAMDANQFLCFGAVVYDDAVLISAMAQPGRGSRCGCGDIFIVYIPDIPHSS